MYAEKEEVWRANGNIHVRARVGQGNYTMLAAWAMIFGVPSVMVFASLLLEMTGIGFMGESIFTIIVSIAIFLVSLMPAILLARVVVLRYMRFKEVEINITPDQLQGPGVKRDWSKIKSVEIGGITKFGGLILLLQMLIMILDLVVATTIGRLFPNQFAYSLAENCYGVRVDGRLLRAVFYDPDVVTKLANELLFETENRQTLSTLAGAA